MLDVSSFGRIMLRQQLCVLWTNERNYQREPECQGGTLLNKDCTSLHDFIQQVFCICRKLILTYNLLQGVLE